jgi:transcriptional regulator with XRE-family HTH domain
MAARSNQPDRNGDTAVSRNAAGKAKKAKKATKTGATGRTGKKKAAPGASTAKRSAKEPSLSWAALLGEHLSVLVEKTAVGALRRALETGGREIGTWLPDATDMRREAGAYLRELRELTGLTIDELADAIELTDHSVLRAVEAGTATISFELILRLAAILARHDPAPFVMRLVRSYNPLLWQLLEDWGVGRLPVQGVREREFVNILRASDDARALSDEDFERVLDFTRASFETALHFAVDASRNED